MQRQRLSVSRRTTRRTAAALVMLALAATLSVAPEVTPARAQTDDRINVLVIVTDDQRAVGTLSVMPRTRGWFKRKGLVFRNAYATTPQCCPSRASIMTGRYAHNHGVENNDQTANLDHDTTIQRHLRDAGYQTALVGKFLNRWDLTQPPPHFDHYSIFRGGYWARTWNIQGTVRTVPDYSTDYIEGRAKRLLTRWEADDDRPWLMYLTPWAPHEPPEPEPQHAATPVGDTPLNPAMLEADCSDKPQAVDCWARPGQVDTFRRRQLRTLISVDEMVDGVMEKLDELSERRNTIVFFLSDNGVFWGEHGLVGKRAPYRGGIEIPLMIHAPGLVEWRSRDDRLAANIDIAPTIYSLLGIEPEPATDGRPLLDPSWSRDRILIEFEEHKTWPRWASTLTPTEQYTEYYDTDGNVTFREYYDLSVDPWQLGNRLGDDDPDNDPDPQTQALMQLQLQQDRDCGGSECP